VCDVPLYEPQALLAGVTRDIFVAEAPTMPLIGTGLLQGFSLHVEFQSAGTIQVEFLSSPS
jgi:hypothetical protein